MEGYGFANAILDVGKGSDLGEQKAMEMGDLVDFGSNRKSVDVVLPFLQGDRPTCQIFTNHRIESRTRGRSRLEVLPRGQTGIRCVPENQCPNLRPSEVVEAF
jgi:hypothetical protein